MVGTEQTRGWPAGHVVGRLDAEWAVLAEDAAAAEACRRWAALAPPLTGCRTLAEVLAAVRTDPDVVLAALLGAAADGETLAGRVVLQAMLGKVVRMARVDPVGTVDDYVAVLWCVVANYPLVARPRQVAANLALDTLKAVQRERRPVTEEQVQPGTVTRLLDEGSGTALWRTRADGATATSVLRRAEHWQLLDPGTGAVLRSVYVDGLPGRSAARRHHTSPGAIRVRCSRAVQRLARHAALLARPA